MITNTSREAYESVKPNIGAAQTKVLNAIKEIQPCTDVQIGEYLGWAINRITNRRGELFKLMKIEEAGIVKNDSGRKAMSWKV